MQGNIVSRDLLESGYSVYMADLHPEKAQALAKRFPDSNVSEVDLQEYPQILATLFAAEAPVVVNCAEGDWNLAVYKACLEYGAHCIDLGSDIPMTEDQLKLHKKFENAGLVAITGCGSTPGINNVMLYYAVTNALDTLDTIEAGFAWDSNIKKFVIPFSIESIIEEFTDPAPVIIKSKWEKRVPTHYKEERDFKLIGRQIHFPVRHPETYTFFRYYQRRGLQNVIFYAGFPDHSRTVIEHYIDSGLGEWEPREIMGTMIRPIEFLSRILHDMVRPPGYTETENLWVLAKGMKGNKATQVLMECLVPTLPGWEEAGCNIDTAFPASIIAQMIKEGVITSPGSFAPGPVVPYDKFFPALAKRQMKIYMNGKALLGS